MVVQQSALHRNQRIAAKTLYIILMIAVAVEVYGILYDNDYLKVFTLEYGIVFVAGFVLAFTFVWLTAKRNIRILISNSYLEISHDEDTIRIAWRDVKKIKQPSLLRSHWLFELKQGRTIRIPENYFSKKQRKQLKTYINRATAYIRS